MVNYHCRISKLYLNLIQIFLFENVKGLWRTTRHRQYFEELKSLLHKADYCTTEKLVNALAFGTPQDRERIMLFGVKKMFLAKEKIYNETIIDFPWENNIKYTINEIQKCDWPDKSPFIENRYIEQPTNIIPELTVQYWFEKNDVKNHPNGGEFFSQKAGLKRMQTIQEGDVSKKCFKRLHRWRYSPTAAYRNNEVHLHPYYARRLSVAETLAIQSLPKNFYLPKEMTLTAKFKTIGNGVPYLLAKAIAKTIKEYMEAL